jgi:hypothetical protein
VNSSRDESPIDADNGHRRSSERDASDSLQEESHSVQFYFFFSQYICITVHFIFTVFLFFLIVPV